MPPAWPWKTCCVRSAQRSAGERDAAVRENIRQAAILDHKQKIGYVNAVDMKLEELSASEQKQMEAEQAADQAAEAAESGETAPATDTDAQEETTTETADQQ